MNLATNQRTQRRDRTNVYMCHLDHLLQLPWAHLRRVPPTVIPIGLPTIDFTKGTSPDSILIGEVIGLLQSPAKTVISALNAGGKLASLVQALESRAEAAQA